MGNGVFFWFAYHVFSFTTTWRVFGGCLQTSQHVTCGQHSNHSKVCGAGLSLVQLSCGQQALSNWLENINFALVTRGCQELKACVSEALVY